MKLRYRFNFLALDLLLDEKYNRGKITDVSKKLIWVLMIVFVGERYTRKGKRFISSALPFTLSFGIKHHSLLAHSIYQTADTLNFESQGASVISGEGIANGLHGKQEHVRLPNKIESKIPPTL